MTTYQPKVELYVKNGRVQFANIFNGSRWTCNAGWNDQLQQHWLQMGASIHVILTH